MKAQHAKQGQPTPVKPSTQGKTRSDSLALSMLATMEWGTALHGRGSVEAALQQIGAAAGAQIVRLLQVSEAPHRKLCLASADLDGQEDRYPPPAELCDPLLRAGIAHGRVASVWAYSKAVDNLVVIPSLRIRRWVEARGIVEILCIVLTTEEAGTYFLELSFRADPGGAVTNLVEAMAPALSEGWARRDPDVLPSMRRAGLAVVSAQTAPQKPILADSNPAGLTRAEFRICALLAEGHAARDIPAEIGISEATLRSHLRSIYAKTETTGQAGLIHRLLT